MMAGIPYGDLEAIFFDLGNTLVAVDRQLAEIELLAAVADGGTPWKIQLAEAALDRGDWLADRGLNGAAITQYKVAWLLANGA